ncbi:MAG: hypothetical protein ABW156_08580 [Jiangellaceae bacterium]
MARRRRRGHRIPWGTRTRSPDDLSEFPDDRPFGDPPGGHSPGAGGAGVREPRRPKPAPPGMSAEADPEPDTFLDFTTAH